MSKWIVIQWKNSKARKYFDLKTEISGIGNRMENNSAKVLFFSRFCLNAPYCFFDDGAFDLHF